MIKAYTREDVVALIKSGEITSLFDIFYKFKYPTSRLAGAVSSNKNRLSNIISSPYNATFKECRRIANYFGVDYTVIQNLINQQIDNSTYRRLFIKNFTPPKEYYPDHIREMLADIKKERQEK